MNKIITVDENKIVSYCPKCDCKRIWYAIDGNMFRCGCCSLEIIV